MGWPLSRGRGSCFHVSLLLLLLPLPMLLLLLLLTPHITRWSCATSSWQHGLCLVGWLPLSDAITSSLASASRLVPVCPFGFRSLTVRFSFGAQYQHHGRQY